MQPDGILRPIDGPDNLLICSAMFRTYDVYLLGPDLQALIHSCHPTHFGADIPRERSGGIAHGSLSHIDLWPFTPFRSIIGFPGHFSTVEVTNGALFR